MTKIAESAVVLYVNMSDQICYLLTSRNDEKIIISTVGASLECELKANFSLYSHTFLMFSKRKRLYLVMHEFEFGCFNLFL